MMVALLWVLVLAAAHACFMVPAGAQRATTTTWVRPVDGPVTRSFEHPDRYGPGHRGVTFAAPFGTAVRAAGGGVVTFAGTIAGVRWLSVAHANGLRTTYGHLDTLVVARGDRVEAGVPIATVDATGSLHLGLRRDDEYLDPMQLFDAMRARSRIRLVTPRGLVR